jgi:hypothetical protein
MLARRRDDPTLGSPRDRLRKRPICHHTCTKPSTKELQHPSVRHPLAEQRQELVVVDLAEEVRNVGLEDEALAVFETDSDPLHGVGRRPLRAKPEGAREEVGLEYLRNWPVGRTWAFAVV